MPARIEREGRRKAKDNPELPYPFIHGHDRERHRGTASDRLQDHRHAPPWQTSKDAFRFCEGFRMPAASNRATNAGGRRTKTATGRNRDLGALEGPRRAACSAMGI